MNDLDIRNLALSMLKADLDNGVVMAGGSLVHLRSILDGLRSESDHKTPSPKAVRNVVSTKPFMTAADEGVAPAIPLSKSVQPDYIVCLEDGTRHTMLKRYLRRVFNMTPEQYRLRWNLPVDYPLVAPNYSESKRNVAFRLGFGTIEARIRENRHPAH